MNPPPETGHAPIIPRLVLVCGAVVALAGLWMGGAAWMRHLERSAPFDAEEWGRQPAERYRMVRSWVRVHAPKTTNVQQVVSMLGAPDMNYAPRYSYAELIFYIGPEGKDEQVLTIDFDAPRNTRCRVFRIGLDDW